MKSLKKIISVFLALVMILPLIPVLELPVSAAETSGTTGNCTWTLDGTVLTISGKGNGNMGDLYSSSSPLPWGREITDVIIEDGVTSIGDFSFLNCTKIKSITIPDSVIVIGDFVFSGCTALTNVSIGNGVTILGEYAFWNCTALESVTMGSSVASIGNSAFGRCANLSSITFPDSVTTIGEGAFSGCSGLTNVTINGVTSIGEYAFSDCNKLTSVSIGNSDINIGKFAFQDCTTLTSITIGNGDTTIGRKAFENCNALESVTIGNGNTTISEFTFEDCAALTTVTIGNGNTAIGYYAFCDCRALTTVTIGNGNTTIDFHSFFGCNALTDVWYGGSSQSEITFDDGNAPIINATWHYVDNACDPDCNECGAVRNASHTYGNDLDTTCNECGATRNLPYDSYGTTGECFWYLEGTKLTIFGNGAMRDYSYSISVPWGTSITEVIIEDGVTTVGNYAFENCSNLTSVIIPNSVTTIGEDAFYACTSLTAVTIPGSVTSIGNGAFCNCNHLTSIIIPDGVTTIGNWTFSGCTSLTAVAIGNSVTTIGNFAFTWCDILTSIEVEAGNTVYHSAGNCLIETTSKTLIAGCKNSVIPADGSVTSIGYTAFHGCTGLTSVTIPDSVTSIEENAFFSCTSLTSIVIPDSVTHISWEAFSFASLTDVWYEGSSFDSIFIEDSEILNATWHFNSCMGNAETHEHAYDNACNDTICNNCGFVRSTVHHVYDNACDTSCNECGATREVPDHVYSGAKDGLCNECGYQRTLSFLAFYGANLTLENDLTVNFAVQKSLIDESGFTDFRVVFTLGKRAITVTEYREEQGYYVFAFKNLAPQMVGDEIEATLYATMNGTEFNGNTIRYTVTRYCKQVLADSNASLDLKILIADLMQYAAAAQRYTNYKTDSLVTGLMTEAEKKFITAAAPEATSVSNGKYKEIENPTVTLTGASLNLSESVAIQLQFTAADITGLTAEVRDSRGRFLATLTEEEMTKSGSTYTLFYKGLNAGEMQKAVFITFYDASGTAVSNTLRYSVESYVAIVHQYGGDAKLVALLDAMLNYGISAEIYANK